MNLVTGGTGLLGSHIVEQLIKRGRPVRALVRKGSDTRWLKSQGVELVEGDLTDKEALRKACVGADYVYHAAARVGDWGPWHEFVEFTINGTANMIEAVAAAKVKRYIHISSISTYGHVNGKGLEIDETAPLGVGLYKWSYYSRAKVEADKLVRAAHKEGRICATIIRPSWIYGPRDRATIARLVTAIRNKKIKLIGDGDNRLNVVYAGNVAEGCILAADNEKAAGQEYNCCNDGVLTQKQYFNMVAAALGEPPVTKKVPYKVAYNAGFILECIGHLFRFKKPPLITRYSVWLMGRHSFFKADKARRELGWQPTVTYEQGIPMTVQWYLKECEGK